MQSLFPLKGEVGHYRCAIYRGDCSCNQNYIGEPVRNAKIRWTLISKAPENFRKRRVVEAYFIKTVCPTLNEQLDNNILTLFSNGIT